MFKLLDQKIRRAFSQAAVQYDVLTSLHKEIGRELIERIKDVRDLTAVLDVGMGTGWLTAKLKDFSPESLVVGLDAAAGMIQMAQEQNNGYKIVQADARALPFQAGIFDIVISNLSYQWVGDLTAAFTSCHRVLKPGGRFCFTMFGGKTLEELFVSLENSAAGDHKDKSKTLYRLAGKDQVQEAMARAGFEEITMEHERIRSHFSDTMSLLKWVRDIGANNLGDDIFLGKEWLAAAGDYYHRHFKDPFGIYATFEVIWANAKK